MLQPKRESWEGVPYRKKWNNLRLRAEPRAGGEGKARGPPQLTNQRSKWTRSSENPIFLHAPARKLLGNQDGTRWWGILEQAGRLWNFSSAGLNPRPGGEVLPPPRLLPVSGREGREDYSTVKKEAAHVWWSPVFSSWFLFHASEYLCRFEVLLSFLALYFCRWFYRWLKNNFDYSSPIFSFLFIHLATRICLELSQALIIFIFQSWYNLW
jgi:hypothetical protein